MTQKRRFELLEAGLGSTAVPGPARQQPKPSPWMAVGLGYRSADFDTDDVYVFACRINDEGDLALYRSVSRPFSQSPPTQSTTPPHAE
jgi:hypothetical protein